MIKHDFCIKGEGNKGDAQKILDFFEMIGVTNPHHFTCDGVSGLYYVNCQNNVDMVSNCGRRHYTINDMLKENPYKIGDKIVYSELDGNFNTNILVYIIVKAKWNHETNRVDYYAQNGLDEPFVLNRNNILTKYEDYEMGVLTSTESLIAINARGETGWVEQSSIDTSVLKGLNGKVSLNEFDCEEIEIDLAGKYNIEFREDKVFAIKKRIVEPSNMMML